MDPGIAKYSLSLVLQVARGWWARSNTTRTCSTWGLQGWRSHFTRLLEAVSPDLTLAELPLSSLPAACWSSGTTPAPLARDRRFLVVPIARGPLMLWLTGMDGRTTHDTRADLEALGLAEVLRQRGVGPGCAWLLAALARSWSRGSGILASGGVWVPLDASSPSERLAMMLDDTARRGARAAELRASLPAGT